MRRLWLGYLVFALAPALARPVSAADLPSQTSTSAPAYQPVIVSNYDWTGFYLGVNGGGAWGSSRYSLGTADSNGFGVAGGLAGGTAGFNYQLGHVVVGFEGDLDWSDVSGSAICPNPASACATRNDVIGTARGRIGYAFDLFMPFVTGGAAYGDIDANVSGPGSAASNQLGWSLGGGIEYALAGSWTAKIEYFHVNLGSFDCGASCGPTSPNRVRSDEDAVRAGVNFKFDAGGDPGGRN